MSEKLKLIKLDGSTVKQDGTPGKPSKLFSFLDLPPDDYSDLSFTPDQALKIRNHLYYLSTGSSAAVPLTCGGGTKCPFASRCPYVREEREARALDPETTVRIVPLGRPCLIEVNLLSSWTQLYIQEYEIDEKDWSEYSLVRELAEIELLLYRVNNNLNKPENADLTQETVVAVDKEGTALTKIEESAHWNVKERLLNRKSRLIKLMVGDRQEKFKRDAALKQTKEDDQSKSSAKLKRELNRVLQRAKMLETELEVDEDEISVVEVEEVRNPKDLLGE